MKVKTAAPFMLIAFCALAVGWVNNILWTFGQSDLGQIALGILGVFLPPIGAIHGVWLWFV